MQNLLGLLLTVCGVALGLYAGLWWAFIGGIVQIIEQIRGPELSAMSVAIGIAKVVFAGVIGTVCAVVCVAPGVAMLGSD